MDYQKLLKEKKAVVFELDDVIFPEKDYLLQVYYLFSEFIAYTEQVNASEILAAFKDYYEAKGDENIFHEMAIKFPILTKYETNFNKLHGTARLPLKLLLYKNMLELMQEVVTERKHLILMVSGCPIIQLNKIKQLEWNGLEKYITVYFLLELKMNKAEGLKMIAEKYELQTADLLHVDEKI